MYVSKAFGFRHLPKTGGMWVRWTLMDFFPSLQRLTAFSTHGAHAVSESPMFTIVRNPWAWHVSLYEFNRNGSTEMIRKFAVPKQRPGAFTFVDFKNLEFDEFIRIFNETDRVKKQEILDQYKVKLANYEPITACALMNWLRNDTSLYETIFEMYSRQCVFIARTEHINEDVKSFLRSIDELTPEVEAAMDAQPPRNVGVSTKSYKSYYTDQTRDLVGSANKNIIDTYNYTFDDLT